MSKLTTTLTVYLPDTRGVELARYGQGNLKIGPGVYTYSRSPGRQFTCPGSTDECEAICYAKRIEGVVAAIHAGNNVEDVPPIPDDCTILRIHIAGDFDSVEYVDAWIARLAERPDVTVWAYTRSWRVLNLLPALERLRALPNVQLFASMDESHVDVPPPDWRRAWIDGDERAGEPVRIAAHDEFSDGMRWRRTRDGRKSLICPEETKHKANCVECGHCFKERPMDVTFLRH